MKDLLDLMPKITDEQKGIIDKNIKVIFDVVNKEYRKEPLSIKNDLYSQGYIVMCNHIQNYEDTDNIYNFMQNVLRYSLRNYFTRTVLGYKSKSTAYDMNDQDKENKQVYDELYKEKLDNWKRELKIWEEYRKEWCSHYSEPFNVDKPKKPSKTCYVVRKRNLSVEIKEDTSSYQYDYIEDERRKMISTAIDGLSPIKQKFIIEVFFNNKKPKLVVKEINREIKTILDDVKFKIEMCDYLNIKRDEIIDTNTDNPIQKYVYKKILANKEPINKIYNKIKAHGADYYKNSILDEMRKKLQSRIK
jgi:hypothetical protein